MKNNENKIVESNSSEINLHNATATKKSKTMQSDASVDKSNLSDKLFYEDVVADVKKDFAERQRARRPYELAWQLNMNFMMGNQYCGISERGKIEQEDKFFFWQEKEVFNHIAPIIETRLARLNRVRPTMSVRPFSGSDSDLNSARLSTKILRSAVDKLELDRLVSAGTTWSDICGTSFYKVTWNSSLGDMYELGGKVAHSGELEITVCPPFEIYPSSNVCADIEDCTSIIHARAYPVTEIKRLWGEEIVGEKVQVFSFDGGGKVGGLGYNSTVPSVTQETKDEHAVVIERYTRPTQDYPKGKLEIVAGDKILYFGDLPYEIGNDGRCDLPFVRQIAHEQAGCFWGSSIIERLIPIQRAYNAVKNRKHEFLNRLSMGVLTVEDGSVDTENLEEEGLSPGKILVYRQGSNKPMLMDAGNVPTDFSYEEDRLLNEFVIVSGVSEFARNSTTPTNVTSGVALQLLIEQDDTRLSATCDSIKRAIKTIGKYSLRLYKQFAITKRLVKLSDDNGGVEVYYFKNSDLSCDDIVFETENELSNSPATRKGVIMDLLSAGILYDKDGKLTDSNKVKILSMMGFGNWESSQDLSQLHLKRASKENLDITTAKILPVDDHRIHIEEHTRFIISGEADKKGGNITEKILCHIREHKENLAIESNS